MSDITSKIAAELWLEFNAAPVNTLFDQKVIANIRGCSTATLERDRWAGGGIPFIKLKRAVRYRKGDVMAWLDKFHPQSSTAENMRAGG